MTQNQIIITTATAEDDGTIAQHFYQLWLDNGIATELISDRAMETTLEFITHARQELSFQAFLAIVDGQVAGSVSCQLFAGLYPNPFQPSFRQYGYIWNVFVESAYRRQGIGTQLTKRAVAYLKTLDCTHAILHASPHGKPVYEQLGFVPKNEMILEIE